MMMSLLEEEQVIVKFYTDPKYTKEVRSFIVRLGETRRMYTRITNNTFFKIENIMLGDKRATMIKGIRSIPPNSSRRYIIDYYADPKIERQFDMRIYYDTITESESS